MPIPQKIRVVVCLGEYCNLGRRGDSVLKAVQPIVNAAAQEETLPPIKLETARCLSMCAVGPNMVIYPEDLVFNKLTPAQAVEAINRYLESVRETVHDDLDSTPIADES
ncbi:MAG: (2Fe-2S) ferredoxin domain-containing protein [Anaerolineae bacterium]